MKKLFSLMLTLVFVMSFAGTAMAMSAPMSPFSDVPDGHWSLAAIWKLAQAGIIDGYGDQTFRGNKTITRYEMAQMVARAMAHSDKADAELKALIDKLAVEYADELNNLGVRVSKLEEKTRIGWNFESRIRYTDSQPSWTNYHSAEGTDRFDWRQRIILSGEVNDNVSYIARLETSNNDNKAGHNGYVAFGSTGSPTVGISLAYFNVKNFLGSFDQLSIGRVDTRGITNGLLNGKDANNDGVILTKTFGDTKLSMLYTDQTANSEVALANLDFKLADNLKLNVAYQTGNWTDMNTWFANFGTFDGKTKSFDVGAQAKFGKVYLTGEYVNTQTENIYQGDPSFKAYAVQLTNGVTGYLFPTYNLVDPKSAHSDAFALAYVRIDDVATPGGMSAFNYYDTNVSNGQYNSWGSDNESRGWYFTYQNVVSKNIVWTAEYANQKDVSGENCKRWSTNFQFFF